MDLNALPCNTEFAYAHKFQPHPYLFSSRGMMIAPINTKVPMNTQFQLIELEKRQDLMSSPNPPKSPKSPKSPKKKVKFQQ